MLVERRPFTDVGEVNTNVMSCLEYLWCVILENGLLMSGR